jgi:hypothetical protein
VVSADFWGSAGFDVSVGFGDAVVFGASALGCSVSGLLATGTSFDGSVDSVISASVADSAAFSLGPSIATVTGLEDAGDGAVTVGVLSLGGGSVVIDTWLMLCAPLHAASINTNTSNRGISIFLIGIASLISEPGKAGELLNNCFLRFYFF